MIKVIFKDTVKQTELVLPVTPAAFEAEKGVNLEIVNVHAVGDVALAGYGATLPLTLEALFPAQAYPFCAATPLPPYDYVEKLLTWANAGTPVRYIVSGTGVNMAVLIESVRYGENDGTGDVNATIHMRPYRALNLVEVQTSAGTAVEVSNREPDALQTDEQSYVVVSGDTLSAICRKYYGDASLYLKLASYNGIKNANLINVGQTLKIPPLDVLNTTAITAVAVSATPKVATAYDGYTAQLSNWLSTRVTV